MVISCMTNPSLILQRQQYDKTTNDSQICQQGAFLSIITHPWVTCSEVESTNLLTDASIFFLGLYDIFNLY